MTQIRATRDSTAVPLTFALTRPDGQTGITILFELRDGATLNSYLDFSDDTFKTSGWGSKASTLTELGNGLYSSLVNVASITNLATLTEHIAVEYRSSAVTPNFSGEDIISLPLVVDGGVDEIRFQKETLALASGDIVVSGNDYAYKNRTGVETLFVNEDNDPTNRTRLFP